MYNHLDIKLQTFFKSQMLLVASDDSSSKTDPNPGCKRGNHQASPVDDLPGILADPMSGTLPRAPRKDVATWVYTHRGFFWQDRWSGCKLPLALRSRLVPVSGICLCSAGFDVTAKKSGHGRVASYISGLRGIGMMSHPSKRNRIAIDRFLSRGKWPIPE